MLSVFKALNVNKPQLREFDPLTIQRMKEGAYLVKMISEVQIAARKCEFYAGNAIDQEIKNIFNDEVKILRQTAHTLQQYYESISAE